MLIDFEKAVYYLFRKKKRIDLICEHQHPTASKCCLNHRPAELRSTIQESEREQIKKKKKKTKQSQNERVLLPSRGRSESSRLSTQAGKF